MEKEFIPYEQALALKELGFDEICLATYRGGGLYNSGSGGYYSDGNWGEHLSYGELNQWVSAPLYQQAFRWFREEHGIFSSIWCFETEQKFFIEFGFGIHKFEIDNKKEAELECLKKLIEIVKSK